jgi:hypothetical protein
MKKKYLTAKEKIQLALEGKDVPICVSCDLDKNRNGFICKIRSVWDGSLKNKKIKL